MRAGDGDACGGAPELTSPMPAAAAAVTALRSDLITPEMATLCRALRTTAAAGVVGSAANTRLGSMVDAALQSLPWGGVHVTANGVRRSCSLIFDAVQSHGFILGEYGNQFRTEVSAAPFLQPCRAAAGT